MLHLSRIILAGILFFSISCASQRAPVPAGIVPAQGEVSAEDEQYGHEVLNILTQDYPLEYNDRDIRRVRDIVDALTEAAHVSSNPWHVYVLKGDDFKNAAATRGNYVFVWTGMLNTVRDDHELATVLAHEIGHVLAGHTVPDPAEEANQIMAQIAGLAAQQVVASRGSWGLAADLAELVVRSSIEAFLVNPDAQRLELEADQIGLFIMADAGFDPERALAFWRRMESDPDFSGFPIEFLSTHPTSGERIAHLERHLPQAIDRYKKRRGDKTFSFTAKESSAAVEKSKQVELPGVPPPIHQLIWTVREPKVTVHARPNEGSKKLRDLRFESQIRVKLIHGEWLEIDDPVAGFVKAGSVTPVIAHFEK